MRFIGRSASSEPCEGEDAADLLAQPHMHLWSDEPQFVQWTYSENGPTQWVLIAEYETFAAPIGFLDERPDLPRHTGVDAEGGPNFAIPSARSDPDF